MSRGRFTRGWLMKTYSRVNEESNEAKIRNDKLQCIRSDKETEDILDDGNRCLEQKNDVNTRDRYGNTQLHVAAYYGLDAIAELLLSRNANVNALGKCQQTPLHEAVSRGNTNIVALLLNKNVDVNARDQYGYTPLHVAVLEGQDNIVKLLLSTNVDVDVRGRYCAQTPLHLAAKYGKADIATLLLSKHADVNTTDSYGDTPLHAALWAEQENIFKLLLDKHFDVNAKGVFGKTLLHFSAQCGMTDIVTLLLSKHADIYATDDNGDMPLHLALRYAQEHIVKLLLDKNVDVNARGHSGQTLLHIAAYGSTDIMTLLFSKCADVNAKDKFGDTPLHVALREGQENIVKLLLDKNVDFNARGQFGYTPLHIAAKYGMADIVTLLLSKHADVTLTDMFVDTPLHVALQEGQENIGKLLLDKNENVNTKGQFEQTLLHFAAKRGMIDIMTLLLSKHADINARDTFGDTPLHMALRERQVNIAKLLLDKNVDANARGNLGQTLLHIAAGCDMIDIVTMLISKHADVNAVDKYGNTPLHVALWEGEENIIKLLLENNVDVNSRGEYRKTPLHIAVECGMTDIVTLLFNKNADVNAVDMFGDTPLHVALWRGQENIVKLLLDKNVDLNTKGEFEKMSLHLAVECGMIDIVTLLLSKRADVNATDENGDTPLHVALRKGQKIIVKILLDESIEVNARGQFEETPLHIAAKYGMTDIVTLLFSKNADVNATDLFGDTPLHVAIRKRQASIVKILLDKNVDVNARGQFEETPLHIAAENGMTNIVTLLISKDADVNATDDNGDTPLHGALRKLHENIVKILLNKNVDVNAKGEFEKTPLHLAVECGMIDIVTLLFSKHADVNATDENGDTPLHTVGRYRQEEIVKLLLKKNANVNFRNKLGKSPLHKAIYDKNIHIVPLLLEKRTYVNTQNEMGNTIVHIIVHEEANINAKDSDGNTPLHEAARSLDKDMAALLISYGADVTLRNNDGDTPLFLCQLFSFEDSAEIVQLLQIAEIEAQKHCDDVQSNDPDTALDNNSHKIHKTMNLKTIDDSGFSGQLYETKLISLFYLRMLNSEHFEWDFFLGVNIDDIGDMDDICVRYRMRDQRRPVVLFIQGKHKKNPKSKLIYNDLWSNCEGFDLKKYFRSYLKIIEKFQLDSKDPMFHGDFEDIDCYFILYTSAQESLGKKKKTENKVNEIIRELIFTSESTEPYQYSYDDADMDNLMKAVGAKDLTSVKYYTAHAKTFFSKLWIYSNQANESKVESIVKKEVNRYCNDKSDSNNVLLEQYSDAIFLIIHHNIRQWWRSRTKVPYLTRSNDLFKLAKLIFLADVLFIFCDAVNYLKNDVQLQFNSFLHFTTATIGDVHIFLRELLTIINSLKLNNNDIDFDTLSLNFLTTDKRLEREITPLDSDKSTYSDLSRNFLNLSPAVKLYNEKCNEFNYEKRSGTSEVGGVLLKMNMSSLIFLRALNHVQIDHNTVLLRAKIPGISMTDICLQFQLIDEQRPVMLFMQLIYRMDPEVRKLKSEMLWSDSENHSLFKYFSSYLKIKERFQNKEDRIFEVGYQNADCNFFLCTSVENSFPRKKTNRLVSREIMDLINTGDNINAFQLDHDDVDIRRLVSVTAKDQLNKLGKVFLKSVLHNKNCPNLLSDTLIAKYHVVMAHEVLQPCEEQPMIDQYRKWKFRYEFFYSNLEHLITLKESFFKTMQSKCHNCSQNELQLLEFKLPLAFGNLDMKFRNNKNQTDRIKLVADKLMCLLELNKNTKIVEINDDYVGPDKMLQQGFIDVNGGIGSAVGNLLIFDRNTKSLKFDLKNKSLPYNANLFLNELKDDRYSPVNEDLSVYRIKINVDNFPKSSFYDDENDIRQARDFLSKFWIYPIQTKEDKIERIFKYEINKLVSENQSYYKNGNISDLISLLSLNEMQKWYLLPNESPYLSRASELFERAELAYIYSLLQSVVNFMYISGMYSIDIKVEQTSNKQEQYKNTAELFQKISSKLLNILIPQQSDQVIKLKCPRKSKYNKSKLTLKIHPRMESVLLVFTAEFNGGFGYRAFAKVGFIHQGSGTKISQGKGKLNIYEQNFFDTHYNYVTDSVDILSDYSGNLITRPSVIEIHDSPDY